MPDIFRQLVMSSRLDNAGSDDREAEHRAATARGRDPHEPCCGEVALIDEGTRSAVPAAQKQKCVRVCVCIIGCFEAGWVRPKGGRGELQGRSARRSVAPRCVGVQHLRRHVALPLDHPRRATLSICDELAKQRVPTDDPENLCVFLVVFENPLLCLGPSLEKASASLRGLRDTCMCSGRMRPRCRLRGVRVVARPPEEEDGRRHARRCRCDERRPVAASFDAHRHLAAHVAHERNPNFKDAGGAQRETSGRSSAFPPNTCAPVSEHVAQRVGYTQDIAVGRGVIADVFDTIGICWLFCAIALSPLWAGDVGHWLRLPSVV